MPLRISRLGRSRLSRARIPRRAPLPLRLFVDPETGDLVFEYGTHLPLTENQLVSLTATTATIIVEPPTFVAEVSTPHPAVILEVT
jgi:hypothetical protein